MISLAQKFLNKGEKIFLTKIAKKLRKPYKYTANYGKSLEKGGKPPHPFGKRVTKNGSDIDEG